MKVLIAGAAGYLGEHVVRAAREAGHEVVAYVRSATAQFPEGVRLIEGDLTDVSRLRSALTGVDAAIFSAGRNWQPGLPLEAYSRENVSIVEAFFEALKDTDPVTRVVFTSSMSAIGGSAQPVVFTETTGRDAIAARRNAYDQAKIDCERLARSARDRGRNVVILNPGFMLGPSASAASKMTTSFLVHWFCLKKNPAIVGAGGHSFCDVRDVARAHVAALTNGAGQYIVAGENLTSSGVQRLMSEQTGIGKPLEVPVAVAYGVSAVMDAVSAATLGHWRNPVHRQFARSLGLYYWADSSRATQDLDYRTRPLAQTIRDTISDFVERRLLPEDFRYVAAIDERNRAAILLLRELAQRNLHRSYLLPRLAAVLDAGRQNSDLNAALESALSAGHFDPKRGGFRWDAGRPDAALEKLRNLLDYCYYASDQFRKKVT
jgi:nucleoside-diphosphate-sugar epimerase